MFLELFEAEQLIILSQIIFIDLVLAGDNAIIIGMVASKFPVEQRKKVIFWGIGGAVILRIILTMLTAYLLQITGLRLIGGLLLLAFVVYNHVSPGLNFLLMNVYGIAFGMLIPGISLYTFKETK